MIAESRGKVAINIESDIVSVRQAVREAATNLGFGTTDTTRIVTAASELARNVFKYAGVGAMTWKEIKDGETNGIELRFEDRGPGIPNVEVALEEGYTTGGGLGMGLPGARKLMDDLTIDSLSGKGTIVVVKKWKKA